MSIEPINSKVKIGGWLIVAAIFVWIGVIGAPLDILFWFAGLRAGTLTSNWLLIEGVAGLVLYVPMVVLFHQRKSVLRWLVVLNAVYAVYGEFHIQLYHPTSTPLAGRIFAVVFEALIAAGIVWYFFASKRVKQTFVR